VIQQGFVATQGCSVTAATTVICGALVRSIAAAVLRGVNIFAIIPMRTSPGKPGLVIGFACEPEQAAHRGGADRRRLLRPVRATR